MYSMICHVMSNTSHVTYAVFQSVVLFTSVRVSSNFIYYMCVCVYIVVIYINVTVYNTVIFNSCLINLHSIMIIVSYIKIIK